MIARHGFASPEYGLTRIMPELREEYDIDTDHKVIERLSMKWGLVILRTTRRPKPSSVQEAIADAGEYAYLVAQMEKITLVQVAEGVHGFHRTPVC